ncbi:MAG: TlpA family protein disulfide reductase [Flavobacteriaceae bacterium]|nr:TlpA family protein disulfide reductase [Flavobacteriaceae bacterium]
MEIKSKTNSWNMQKIKYISYFFLLISVFSCKTEPIAHALKTGIWRGEILVQNNTIPFNFEIIEHIGKFKINLINGDETLKIEEVKVIRDSIFFNMHIFDISVKAKINDTILTGVYIKNYAEDYILPFKAVYHKKGRFDNVSSNNTFDGTWETTFFKDGKETSAVGIFRSENNTLKGTFLTTTGDYRYLDGYTKKDTMYLFGFDGNHLFKFKAVKENDSILKGEFWSGKSWYETFTSVKNANAKLPDANVLTFLKEGYEKIEFSFPDLNGKQVSLKDKKFKNKVVILQISGTWCPNCMDETKFLAAWYKKNKDKGVEILGLAYEVKPDFEYAKKRILNMKEKLNVTYDYVIAGTSTTESASESLPMLNKVMSFPTAIIIDKKGKVRRIHTGFSGPATGIHYEEFVEDFNNLMHELIQE